MAKKSSIAKNNSRIQKSENDYAKRKKLKDIIMDKNITVKERFEASLEFSKLRRDGSKSRIRNRCGVTGRPRGYYSHFKMSRICIRQFAGEALLPGVIKSSW